MLKDVNGSGDTDFSKLAVLWTSLCNPIALSICVTAVVNGDRFGAGEQNLDLRFLYMYLAGMFSSAVLFAAAHILRSEEEGWKANVAYHAHPLSMQFSLLMFFLATYQALHLLNELY
ncbi:hypothetical protein [Micavibrio aeruginosavorus]|uniref:hypothetical protein n=1 Tax=Micavibrio aeruginosavorus TaxID=349221 RepID=UPI003F4AB0C1